jgi:hypothetical protein
VFWVGVEVSIHLSALTRMVPPWPHVAHKAPAFHFNSLANYLVQSSELADDYVEGLPAIVEAKGGIIDVMAEVANLTASILLKSVFSYNNKDVVRTSSIHGACHHRHNIG